jgi:hypothetical protein
MDHDKALREQVRKILDWEDAHAGFDSAVKGLPPKLRGATAPGLPHSAWQLLEHLRLAQKDILEFCVKSDYKEMSWPQDYWPQGPEPPSEKAWDESVAAFVRDRDALKKLAMDPGIDLFARIPHGSGQTYLRELLLVADHAAYHVAQIVDVRRALGAWG